MELQATERFANQVVVVTGGTSGIGLATCKLFARQGAKVVFCGRRAALGQAAQQAISQAGGQAEYVQADVRVEDDVARLIEQARQRYGSLDIVVANAGITVQKALHSYSTAEWQDVIDTNLRGGFFTLKHSVPPMLAAGGGRILVIASSVANVAGAAQSAYVASKAGLVGMVRSAALDYGDKGIRINAILPGTTDTALVRRAAGMENVPDAAWQVGAAQWGKSAVRGLKRMARPEEIAAFIVAMASPDLTFATGAALSSDGGTGAG
ncbi:SDR family NAD(P)-dependent oxidoreductase [Diaphorobacter aerolatus]|uniref:SDR family NAD(P)-dependent oxidoreductase n=1 Tax=Diaphorobacter aerolatus TaxID=1288495 RepID=UPI001D01B869|nr:SDR family NAD(P)-dependent oxidoreductase [Diaphorobacter aerolatus]